MEIIWRGTASVSVKTENTRIEIDPYLHAFNRDLPPLNPEEIKSADGIFITHPHPDHFADIDSFTGSAPVYVSQNGIKRAKRQGFHTQNMIAIAPGERYRVGDISVTVYQSRHCKYNAGIIRKILTSARTYRMMDKVFRMLSDMLRFPISDDIYAFEIEAEGKKIMLFGSAGMDAGTTYPTNADLLIFAFQGRTDMAEYSLPLLQRLKPKKVLFDHIDDAFPPFTTEVDTQEVIRLGKEGLPDTEMSPFTVNQPYYL